MDKNLKRQIGSKLLKAGLKTRTDLDCFKRKMAKKYKIAILKNSELLKIYHEMPAKKRAGLAKGSPLPTLEDILRKRPVRSLSGIVNVSVLTKPYPCPGKCIFCPSQKGIPKSYLAGEPAVQRAVLNKFNPYKQAAMRLRALSETGHPIDKVELRIIGGTWSYYPKNYRQWFVKECFRACNEFSSSPPSKTKIHSTPLLHSSGVLTLKEDQKKNETAKCRIVGIAVETRPDYINIEEIKFMRELGITKVELGVQSLYDDVLQKNQRGHLVKDTITATRLLKNAGFKVSYQVMPGLFGSSSKRDVQMFREIFANPDFMPDYLKIYPLALVKNTKLYQSYKQSKYRPYAEKELTKLLIEAKKLVPCWCRIERIIRDIPPANIVEGGSRILNFREIISKEMKKRGLTCKCIRCREVRSDYDAKEKIRLLRDDYEASGGKEIFLSLENKSRAKIYALLRLRLSSQDAKGCPLHNLQRAALIRDLHTYGQMAQISGSPNTANSAQHKGLGKKLLAEAEKIAKAAGYKKIAVIAGVGARPYYRKLGYRMQNTYMVKTVNG